MNQVENPPSGRVRQLLCLIRGQPLGVPPYGSGKISVLTTNETPPIIDDNLFKDIVKESEFPARKDTKQVPIEISKDLAEVERGRIRRLRDHPA
jgi:hypothetical protein